MQVKNNLIKIKIAISDQAYQTKAEAKKATGAITKNCSIHDLDINQFSKLIRGGHAWTSVCSNNGTFHRSREHFLQADIFALDIDNEGSEQLTLKDALNDTFLKETAWLIYTSYRHTQELNKFRIVFLLPETLADVQEYETIKTAFINKYGDDPSCKDAARLYYGTHPEAEIYPLNNRLTWDTIEAVISATSELSTEGKKSSTVVIPGIITPSKSRRLIATSLRNIAHAPNGQKYTTVRNEARRLGGYIPNGDLDEQDIIDALTNEISNRDIDNLEIAKKGIADGIAHGKSSPLEYVNPYSIFPCCLLAYKAGYDTIKAIHDYCRGANDQETNLYIETFEAIHGADALISVPTKIIDMALHHKLGDKSYNTFKVYAGVALFFNKEYTSKHGRIRRLCHDMIRVSSAGYKSPSIVPVGTKLLSNYIIREALEVLHHRKLLYSAVAKKKFKYFGRAEYFENYEGFENAIKNAWIYKLQKKLEYARKNQKLDEAIQLEEELFKLEKTPRGKIFQFNKSANF